MDATFTDFSSFPLMAASLAAPVMVAVAPSNDNEVDARLISDVLIALRDLLARAADIA